MKENLCVITGPTGIGKSSLSLKLAQNLNGEIISADSMQIYKYMDIGTAKLTKDEMDDITHHIIDIVYPDDDYSVSDFKKDAKAAITSINKKQKLPIVVGGTGLYINSLVYDLNFTKVAFNAEIRDKYEKIVKDRGLDYLHRLLSDIDKVSGGKININDKKRIIRALEVYEVTGKTMSEYNKNFRRENKDYNLVMICLNMERAELYKRINKRVDLMVEAGLLEEVKSIINRGYDLNSVAMQGIGYKEINMYFEGELTLEESLELIKQKSRNYAKRQLTWFRRDNRIKWINIDEFKDIDTLEDYVQQYIVDVLLIQDII